jgi:hypothetical protein
VIEGFGSLRGFWGMVRGTFSQYRDEHALKLLNEFAPHGTGPQSPAKLVQIKEPAHSYEETSA